MPLKNRLTVRINILELACKDNNFRQSLRLNCWKRYGISFSYSDNFHPQILVLFHFFLFFTFELNSNWFIYFFYTKNDSAVSRHLVLYWRLELYFKFVCCLFSIFFSAYFLCCCCLGTKFSNVTLYGSVDSDIYLSLCIHIHRNWTEIKMK